MLTCHFRELSVVPPSMYVSGAPILHLIQHPKMAAEYLRGKRESGEDI